MLKAISEVFFPPKPTPLFVFCSEFFVLGGGGVKGCAEEHRGVRTS